jgi:hypothetical protein
VKIIHLKKIGRNARWNEVWTKEVGVYTRLEVNRHDVHLVEGPRTRRAFAHPVADTVIDALLAEEMTAGLQSRTLEVVATYRTEGKGLEKLADARLNSADELDLREDPPPL